MKKYHKRDHSLNLYILKEVKRKMTSQLIDIINNFDTVNQVVVTIGGFGGIAHPTLESLANLYQENSSFKGAGKMSRGALIGGGVMGYVSHLSTDNYLLFYSIAENSLLMAGTSFLAYSATKNFIENFLEKSYK